MSRFQFEPTVFPLSHYPVPIQSDEGGEKTLEGFPVLTPSVGGRRIPFTSYLEGNVLTDPLVIRVLLRQGKRPSILSSSLVSYKRLGSLRHLNFVSLLSDRVIILSPRERIRTTDEKEKRQTCDNFKVKTGLPYSVCVRQRLLPVRPFY